MSVLQKAAQKLRGARYIEWVLLTAALAALVLLLTDAPADSAYEATALEKRMESVLSSVEGAGRVRVLVNSEDAAAVFSAGGSAAGGVLVVAEGAGDILVAMELEQAVKALLGVESEQIGILTMKEADS